MPFARLVVERCAPLHQRRERLAVERGCTGLDRGEHLVREVDHRASIAVGERDQRLARILVKRKRPLLGLLGAVQKLAQRRLVEPVEHEHGGTAQQRAVELEGRVLGRRTDQGDGPVLHVRQEAVLLGTVEAVDLVDEKQRAASLLAAGLGAVEGLAQVLHAREDRGKLLELELRLVGEQPRDRRLAGAGRAPQDEARQPAACQHARQRALGADELILAHDFGERLRAQPVGERTRRAFFQAGGFEQRRH